MCGGTEGAKGLEPGEVPDPPFGPKRGTWKPDEGGLQRPDLGLKGGFGQVQVGPGIGAYGALEKAPPGRF